MPALAYIFASQNELPTVYDSEWFDGTCTWIHALSSAWDRLIRDLPPSEKPPEPPYRNLSTNMANMPPSKCREIAPQADEGAKKVFERWKNAGTVPALDAGLIAELTGIQSKVSIQSLNGYRGGFKAVPAAKLKHGATAGFLMVSSDPFEFKITQNVCIELNIFSEISRAYGADALALWTWGSTIGLLLAKSSSPNSRPVFFGPFHVGSQTRSSEHIQRVMADLRAGFDGSRLRPDWLAIESQLRSPELSVSKWFAAFGLPGAPDNSPADATALWQAWDRATEALLSGNKPEASDSKLVKKALEQSGTDDKLPTKPAKGNGALAYPLAGVGETLANTAGWPEGSLWERRSKAAELYAAIANDGVADWLTVGVDSNNLGASASLGRLLQVYPAEFRRDRSWAMQALHEAEVWNGHAFVQPLAVLAEGIGIQLAVVVYPAATREAFRNAFGIEGGLNTTAAAWEADAFIETAVWPKKRPSDLLPDWFKRQRADGVLIIVGEQSKVTVWSKGTEIGTDPASLALGRAPSVAESAEAARYLDVRPLLDALDLQNLLRPPPLDTTVDTSPANRVTATKALATQVPVITLPGAPGHFASASPPEVKDSDYKTRRLVCFEAVGLVEPKRFARDLAALLGKLSHGWFENGEVRACNESLPDWQLLAGLIGDAPAGASFTVVNTDGVGFKLVQS